MKNHLLLFVVLSFFAINNMHAQKNKKTNTIASKDIFVADLMAKMTVEEKIGQLNLPTSGDITTGQANSSNVAKNIEEGKVGGLFNIKSAQKIYEVQKIAVEKSRLKIPLLFGMDVIHGYETTFPIPLGLSCTWDLDLIKRSAQIAAQEASADGINWTFSPMVDISRDPRWGRVSEGSGEDPYLGSQIAKAMVTGYQGDDLTKNNTILSCVKHFALYGAPDAGRDYNTVDMSRIKMYNDYFPPYKAAVDAGVASAMASFNEIDGIPATGNKWLMTEVLRNQWGFKGFVVTDYTGIEEMMYHGMGDFQTVSAMALNAGIDMDMVSDGFLKTLKKSLDENKVTIEQIDNATRLILNSKYDLGLFQDPYKYCDVKRAKVEVFTKENRAEARSIAAQSLVLLKNTNQLLPLKKSGTIALIGPLADAKENMAGTWSVATKQENSISLLAGIKEVVGANAKIQYAKGSNLVYDAKLEEHATMFGKTLHRDNRTDKELLDEAVKIANQSDVIVAALGESAEFSEKRGHEVPVIGEKEKFFGRDDYSEEEAMALLNLGKLASQTKNCMNCHTLLGNGAYYAPDLTKAWLDPMWDSYMLRMGKASKEEAIAEFLQHPSDNPSNERMMPNLGITADEAKGLVAFLKHMSSIDTNGFPRNFGKIEGGIHGR